MTGLKGHTSEFHVWNYHLLTDARQCVGVGKQLFVRRSLGYRCEELDSTAHELQHFNTIIINLLHTRSSLSRQCEIPGRFAALLRGTRHVKCYSYHARTSVTVSGEGRNATVHDPKPYISHLKQNRLLLNTCMDANMQLTINSFRQLFPDISLIFSKIPDFSLTAVKLPDISRFSRQVVTLISTLHVSDQHLRIIRK